jgi:hypothetical protein
MLFEEYEIIVAFLTEMCLATFNKFIKLEHYSNIA